MDNKWITTIVALFGFIVGSATTFITTNFQLQQQEHFESKRLDIQKLEELHMVISQIDVAYRTLSASISFGTDERPKINIPIDRATMLVGFYAPHLDSEMRRLEKIRQEFGQTYANILVWSSMKLPNKDIEEQQREISKNYENLRKHCELLRAKVVETFQSRK